MNWLDEYIAYNDRGYWRSADGSYWVEQDDGRELELAIGDVDSSEPVEIKEITREEFIISLIGGR